ncbi:hypothetical protein [Candidatus Neoehrlichia procyonis]|uniref:Uncharacterized protein n=1 Tax=Candidatus Neoehrlichia procyonis str. RAC413 TaxID=1359163 RepID=A0A0F3NM74_9RICK|nr:hypothetical protein [Candidatus Neoehrlichia lotoris]KJV68802.1 hypothetical protein NLO413_0167 [Candidatus Neoehrlichia lotoris str. RAC413]
MILIKMRYQYLYKVRNAIDIFNTTRQSNEGFISIKQRVELLT